MPGRQTRGALLHGARVRQDFSGRGSIQARATHADDDSPRAWLGDQRKRLGRPSLQQRTALAVILLVCGCVFLCGACNRAAKGARAAYDHAWRETQVGDLTAALQEASADLAHYSDPHSEWYWRFLLLKAEILMRQGLNEDSLALLNVTLPEEFAHSDLEVWQKLTLGASLAYLSRNQQAQVALDQAKTLAESFQPQLLGEVNLRQGTLYSLQWKLEEARASYHTTLDLAVRLNDPFLKIAALGSLGLLATRMERYDESVDWNKQALQLSESVGAKGSLARIEGNIGWSYYKVGDLESALSRYQEADKDDISAGVPERRVTWLINTGEVHYSLGDYPAANEESQKALVLAKTLKDPGSTIDSLQDLALEAIQSRDFAAAQEYLEEARRMEETAPDPARKIYTSLIAGHQASATRSLALAERFYQGVLSDPQSPRSLQWEAQASLAQVHARLGKKALAEREFAASISTIAKAQRELEHEEFRLSFLSSAIRFYNAYVDFLVAQHRSDDALAIAERSRAQTLTAGLTEPSQALVTSFSRIHPQELAARFNSVIFFYSLGTPHSYLWVITQEKTTLLTLPAQAEIDSLVKSYRDEVLDGDDPLEAAKSPGAGLYSILVQPAAKFILPGARVIVLPDGDLNSLDFDTLIAPRPAPHYWIQDVTLTTANSLTLLERSQSSRPPESPRLFLVGDPVSSEEQFPPLRQAAREMSLVRNYFKEDHRRILSGKEATPAAYFSSEPERFDYLHFVTHGTASRTHPLDSAVILTKSADSTKLYAHEIITRPLNAYLVTVSACDGVGKRTYAGEGLVGLSWAFLRAGAHNVIASLWEVNDDSTPQLMDDLYKGLSAGQDPATALRNAKLDLVRSQGTFRKPFYWAPFQLYAGS
jgi:CHAT domain-containing protein